MRLLAAAAGVLVALAAQAVEYDCKVESKLSDGRPYTEKQLRDGQFSIRIEDDGSKAAISRCSFLPSRQVVTCDRYEVDKVFADEVRQVDGDKPLIGERVKIKKYYRFTGHLDVQVFPDLSFIENNGRGGISDVARRFCPSARTPSWVPSCLPRSALGAVR